jgi:acyl-CoA thioesterase I
MSLTALGVIVRALVRGRRLPANRPATFQGRGAVVCLDASTVQGNVSFDFVTELARRLPDRTFVNAGINGETSSQVLARVPEVVACQPTDVIVMVGANDLFAIRGSRLAGVRHTTFDEYRTNLTAIMHALRPARVAMLSIQPLGERLYSPVNRDMDRLNEIVRTVAATEGAAYLPFNERMKSLLHTAIDRSRTRCRGCCRGWCRTSASVCGWTTLEVVRLPRAHRGSAPG